MTTNRTPAQTVGGSFQDRSLRGFLHEGNDLSPSNRPLSLRSEQVDDLESEGLLIIDPLSAT
jgi:hypothetical protein